MVFAEWLRAGIGSGRVTSRYPKGSFGDEPKLAYLDALPAVNSREGAMGRDEADWAQMAKKVQRLFRKSLHLRHLDVGSCNACESEVLSLSNPYYNIHRLGIFFTASPRHADALLVTGALTHAMKPILLETYEAMPKPRLVIATGVCAVHGGLFADSPEFAGPVDQFVPVDAWIAGCPPHPFAIINGLIEAVEGRNVRHG